MYLLKKKSMIYDSLQTLEFDREGLTKLKKAAKAIHNSGNVHVENEMCMVRALERLGSVALSKEEPDIGAAFLKFSVVTKELSALMKTLVIKKFLYIQQINITTILFYFFLDAKH
jgi:hypothetical protein